MAVDRSFFMNRTSLETKRKHTPFDNGSREDPEVATPLRAKPMRTLGQEPLR
jgi:hypothetical protein